MQISKKLPQFENYPVLFIASGEFDARFYIALNGEITEERRIKLPPREEAREKQLFIHESEGEALGAFGHKDRYVEDLKKKFQKKVHREIHSFIAEYKLKEIYIFSPDYAVNKIMEGLDKSEQRKVRMKFYQEITKINPIEMIKEFWDESQKAIEMKPPLKEEEKKILSKPARKKTLHKT
jgi:hypothetical protein